MSSSEFYAKAIRIASSMCIVKPPSKYRKYLIEFLRRGL